MHKKIVVFLLAFTLGTHLSSCTSKKVESEEAEMADATAAEEGTGDELAADDDIVADLGSEELSEDEKLPEEQALTEDDALADTETPPADMPVEEAAPTEPPPESLADNATSETAPPVEPAPEATPEATPEETAPPVVADSEQSAPPAESMDSPPPIDESASMADSAPPIDEGPKVIAPLRKIETATMERGGQLLNAVYLARPNDNWKSVSTKLYGDPSKVKSLKKANPYIASRGVKVGDKIYYNSPQRPTDRDRMLTYYEDAGLEPQVYVAKAGDNIRAVGKDLLGHKDSWKELWTTNLAVESKSELAEGTQLRYWAADAVAPAMPAQASAESPPAEMPPTEMAPPPPPPADVPAVDPMAANNPPPDSELPPPPPAEASMDAAPPPPPSEPPPPPSASKQAGLGQDPNQTMALGVGGILLLAALTLFVVIRKKKARKQIDFNTTTQTQIE